eukprot:jgi/Hompol1/3107/HPOL_006342-RA
MLHEWIPKELLDRILTLAGPLAQFLHGRMRVSLQSSAVISLMWAECFVADMVAAVPLLPRPAVILGWELLLVHSRRMVRAIKAEMLPGISQWMDLAKTGLQPAFDASDLTEIRSLVRDANRSSVQAGRLVLVHHLLRLYPLYNRPITEISNSNVMQLIVWAAAASGDAAIIRSLLISDLNESIGRTKTPASARHRSAVRVAQHEAAAAAAEFGHLHIVEILCKAVPTTAGAAVQGAVWGGHLSIVQFIAERFPTAFWPPSLTASIRLHRSDILIWLLQHTELRDLACCASIKNDCLQHLNIDVLRFAFEHRIGRPVDPWQLAAVAEQGRLDILQLVFEHEPTIEWPPSILERAIRGQQLVVLKWLHTLGVAGDTVMIMWLAVFYGALEIVRWTHEELGQPFGVDALDFAIQQRHVDVRDSEYVHRAALRNCVWDERGSAAIPAHCGDICTAPANSSVKPKTRKIEIAVFHSKSHSWLRFPLAFHSIVSLKAQCPQSISAEL